MKFKKKLLSIFLGREKWQDFFYKLYNISLLGMNYGGGRIFFSSGELNTIKLLKDKIFKKLDNLLIFDVGANEGYYANALDKIFENQRHVIYSFEPASMTYNLLKKNINTNNIHCFKLGFSDREEVRDLVIYDRSSEYSSLYDINYEYNGIHIKNKEKIKLTTIDLFCKYKQIDMIHFLKLDVEGHEFNILNGAKGMISKDKILTIQFEFGVCNIDSKTFFRDFYYFLNNKYDIYRILKDGLIKITEYNYKIEIFDVTNFIAIHKNVGINL
ncbi:MAG: FkbM family methyltransferase [Promethearchaeota archaeon]